MLGGVLPFDDAARRRPAPTSAGRIPTSRALRPLRAAPVGRAARRRAGDDRVSRSAFDVCGPLPTGVTVLEASAGHRQDVHDRRAGRPLRRRGHAARPAAARHVHADGDRRAARARARAARRRRAGARRARRRADRDDAVVGCSPTAPRTSSPRREHLAPRARRLRRGDDRHDPRLLPGGARRPRRRRRRRARRDVRRGRRRPASTRSSTTSTCAASTAPRTRRVHRAPRRCEIARDRGRQPGRADRAARRAAHGTLPAHARAARRRGPRASSTRASGALACMTYDDLLTRLRRRAARATAATRSPSGCARATRSCWSTSSRTPTRSSGRSCARAFGAASDARADRRPEAGDLRLPRRRRLRLPRRRADAPARAATLDVNWRSDQGLIDAYDALFGGAQLGHEGIVYRHGAAPARRRRGWPARPVARRCGSGSSTATSRRSRSTPQRLRAAPLRARARRRATSPPTSSGCCRPRAVDGRAVRPATSPCSCAPTGTPRWSATRSTPPASRRHQRRRQRVRARRRRASGCGCSRRSSARRRRRARTPPR